MSQEINQDILAQGYIVSLINVTLNHNAAVIEYATHVFTAGGPLKDSHRKRVINQFKDMHKQYQAEYKRIINQYEKEVARVDYDRPRP